MRAGLPNREILQNSESRTPRDPRNAKIGPPMYGDRTPEDKATRPSIPDEDQGLRGIQDLVGFRTSRDSELRGTQDFVGFKTSPDSGLRGIQDFAGDRNFAHPGPGSCSNMVVIH